MAHFIRVLKARRLKNKWKDYVQEKINGLNTNEDEISSSGSSKEINFKQELRKLRLKKPIFKINTRSGVESIGWKSFLGFIGGIFLTFIFFLFIHFGMNISLRTAICACGLLGFVLTTGLAFSSAVRCYVLLLIPFFFSMQGRQALLTYALFLSFTGPGRNTVRNLEILSNSMTCGQEMVRRTQREINDLVEEPVRAIRETIQKAMKAMEGTVGGLRKFLIKIKRIIIIILNVFKMVTRWLENIVTFCNKKMGTPFQRCMKTFDDSIADCKAKLGVIDFLCHVVHIMKALCCTFKCLDFVCLFSECVSNETVEIMKKKLRDLHQHIKNLFHVRIEFCHSYKFKTTPTNTTRVGTKTVLQKLSKKVEKLQAVFSIFGFVFSLFFVLLLFKAYYYRYKYLSSDRYDNVYISNYIIELDMKRARMDRETVLPLEPREKRLYAKPTSIKLLKEEKSRIEESIYLLSLTSFKIITFLFVDYSLFWILITVYEAGREGLGKVEEPRIDVKVEGKGILADFYRKLDDVLQVPENPKGRLNPFHCLPDPVRPDISRYLQIDCGLEKTENAEINVSTGELSCAGDNISYKNNTVKEIHNEMAEKNLNSYWVQWHPYAVGVIMARLLVVLCWLLTVTESYGLRMRNVVMFYYYPDRARERAVWLYNHIIQSRGSFVRHARRHLRRKFGRCTFAVEEATLTQRLFAGFPLLGAAVGRCKENNCLVCGAPGSKSQPLKRCRTPDCQKRYCPDCFASLENVCTICQHPIDYGDVSDMSEEMDSSEEDSCGKTNESVRSESADDYCQESEKFLTFKEMESRSRFRDAEANRLPDYVKLGDLYPDKAEVRRRLKAVVENRLRHIEEEKQKATQTKESEYQKVKQRLKAAICKLKDKNLQHIRNKKMALKQKFLEKIYVLRKLKERRSKQCLPEKDTKPARPTRSKVSFKLKVEEITPSRRNRHNYERLKNALKAKVESLKRRKMLRCEDSFVDDESLA